MGNSNMNDLLSYDSDTGIITWKVSRGGGARAGNIAGAPDNKGYINIKVSGKSYLAHRLAWLLHYGVWPRDQIDHINGLKYDNRIANLREATNSNNQRNCGKPANNTSGYKGVCWHKANSKYQAYCQANGKRYYLGLYPTAEAAHKAYCNFAKEHHAEFFHA